MHTAGAGSFEPRRPPNIDDPDQFKDKGVTYAVRSKETYKNKNVFIFGGGDSALDWTIELSKIAKSISLVHRRDAFRGALHSEEQMRDLVKDGKVKLLTPYVIDGIDGSDKVTSVSLKNFDTKAIAKISFWPETNKKVTLKLNFEGDIENIDRKIDTAELERYITDKGGR